jgi:predicted metal-dependent hydrolase
VLIHELAHLLVPGHGKTFWAWVDRYEFTERARGYLEGVASAAGLDLNDDDVD